LWWATAVFQSSNLGGKGGNRKARLGLSMAKGNFFRGFLFFGGMFGGALLAHPRPKLFSCQIKPLCSKKTEWGGRLGRAKRGARRATGDFKKTGGIFFAVLFGKKKGGAETGEGGRGPKKFSGAFLEGGVGKKKKVSRGDLLGRSGGAHLGLQNFRLGAFGTGFLFFAFDLGRPGHGGA